MFINRLIIFYLLIITTLSGCKEDTDSNTTDKLADCESCIAPEYVETIDSLLIDIIVADDELSYSIWYYPQYFNICSDSLLRELTEIHQKDTLTALVSGDLYSCSDSTEFYFKIEDAQLVTCDEPQISIQDKDLFGVWQSFKIIDKENNRYFKPVCGLSRPSLNITDSLIDGDTGANYFFSESVKFSDSTISLGPVTYTLAAHVSRIGQTYQGAFLSVLSKVDSSLAILNYHIEGNVLTIENKASGFTGYYIAKQ